CGGPRRLRGHSAGGLFPSDWRTIQPAAACDDYQATRDRSDRGVVVVYRPARSPGTSTWTAIRSVRACTATMRRSLTFVPGCALSQPLRDPPPGHGLRMFLAGHNAELECWWRAFQPQWP